MDPNLLNGAEGPGPAAPLAAHLTPRNGEAGCAKAGDAADQESNANESTEIAAQRKPWLRVQAECLLAGFPAKVIEGDDGRPLLAQISGAKS